MRNPNCPICGDNPSIKQLIDYDQFCGIRGEPAPPPATASSEITVDELKARLDRGEGVFISPNQGQVWNLMAGTGGNPLLVNPLTQKNVNPITAPNPNGARGRIELAALHEIAAAFGAPFIFHDLEHPG